MTPDETAQWAGVFRVRTATEVETAHNAAMARAALSAGWRAEGLRRAKATAEAARLQEAFDSGGHFEADDGSWGVWNAELLPTRPT